MPHLPSSFLPAAAFLFTLGGLSSCLSDDTPAGNASSDCIVTGFHIGNVSRTVYLRTRDGLRDSVTHTEVKGTLYKFTVDQQRGLIYNIDSLPPHSDLTKIPGIVISALGTTSLSEREGGEAVRAGSGKNGLTADLSGKPVVTVRSTDGTSAKRYALEVRMHRELGDSVTWTRSPAEAWDGARFAPMSPAAFTAGGRNFDVSGGRPWIYDGANRVADSISSGESTHFPDAHLAVAVLPSPTDPTLTEITLYGLRAGAAQVWKRHVDGRGHYAYGWERLIAPRDAAYRAPALTGATLLPYDGGLLLAGIDAAGHPVLRFSPDRGLTWREHTLVTLPADFPKTPSRLEAAVDDRGILRLRTDAAQVWSARLHRLSWLPTPTEFIRAAARR